MNRIILRIVGLTLIFTLISSVCFAEIDHELIKKNMEKWNYVQFDRGSGTESDPYIIDEAEDLEFMADTVFRVECTYDGKYFRLDKDLYLNDITKPIKEWKSYYPIGWEERPFEGHFDGGGHTIYGFKALDVDYFDYKGFFGRIKNGSIKNLTLSDSYLSLGISEGLHTAVFVNYIFCDGESATIENCHVINPRGSVTRLATNISATNGGTVTIKDCTVDDSKEMMIRAITTGNDAVVNINGLVRSMKDEGEKSENNEINYNKEGMIQYLYTSSTAKNEGKIVIENCINNVDSLNHSPTAGYSSVDRGDYRPYAIGGILGSSYRTSGNDIIRNCTNNSNVFGIGGVGGITGAFVGKIENCVNNGSVYGIEARVGGIVGQHTKGDISCCVNKATVNVVDTDILVGVIRFGGIAGVNNGTVESCINYGDINGSPMGSGSMEVGGIVGRASYIYNCANLGNLVGITASSGGVAGTVALNVPEAVVDNCYNAGNVSASPYNSGSVIALCIKPSENCYYLEGTHQYGRYINKEEKEFDHSDYKALTYEEMTNPESFVGFDFENKWIMPSEKGFPIPSGAHFGDIAIPNETEIDVNGKSINLSGYNINGNNYYKIRDIAYLLNGTKSNFSVDWDSENDIIVIKTKTPYTPLGNENNLIDKNKRAVDIKREKAMLNNKSIELRAYKIDGSNYFTIREVAEIVGFKVDWDDKERRIMIDA